MERARSAPGRAAECCGVGAGAWGAAAVPVPVPAPRGLFGLLPARWLAGLHSSGGAGRHTAGASLAVLRGRGSLSVFLLLLLHLLDDFPDLALCSLGREREAGVRMRFGGGMGTAAQPRASEMSTRSPEQLEGTLRSLLGRAGAPTPEPLPARGSQ